MHNIETSNGQEIKVSRDRFFEIVNYIYSEYADAAQLTKSVVAIWYDLFCQYDERVLTAAAKLLKTRCTYGAPKSHDFAAAIKDILRKMLPKSLQMAPEEALDPRNSTMLLVQDAKNYADIVCQKDSLHTQYESPEDLQRAQNIERAVYNRTFRERFKLQQDRALSLVEAGEHPELAIIKLLAQSKYVQLPAAELVRIGHKVGVKALPEVAKLSARFSISN
jgi:hypothetical protein